MKLLITPFIKVPFFVSSETIWKQAFLLSESWFIYTFCGVEVSWILVFIVTTIMLDGAIFIDYIVNID